MKTILTFLVFLIAISTHAQIVNFDISLKIMKDNFSKSLTASINSKLGKEFFIKKDNLKIVFIAKSNQPKGQLPSSQENTILLEANIFEISNNQEKIISRPKIITQYNKEAMITVNDDLTGDQLEMKIQASRL